MAAADERLDAARHYISLLNLETACQILFEYLEDNAEDAEAWYLLGQSLDEDEAAIAALRRALELNPEHEDAQILIAGLLRDVELITYPIKPDQLANTRPPQDAAQ
jgi:cytochrome c-type biogenesis protein CcmH/NrfG